MGNRSLTSIREVAKLAGVSPATVSRVMNGTANVNEEKKKRVEAAIKETGFQPNELARALYKKSSKMIGIIVPDIENPFFSELAKAVEDTAYQNGYRILLCSSGGDEEKEAAVKRLPSNRNVNIEPGLLSRLMNYFGESCVKVVEKPLKS